MNSSLAKSVVLALISAIASVLVARAQQAPRNTQGAVGYETLADRVNTMELAEERDHAEISLLRSACTAAPTARSFKPITLQNFALTPLKRVPSKLEHLPEQMQTWPADQDANAGPRAAH